MVNQRVEKDSMGEMSVDQEALYGASTQRAVLNFPILGKPINQKVIQAYGFNQVGCCKG